MFKSFARSTGNIIKKIDRSGQVFKALTELAKRDVLIGLPEETIERKPEAGEEPINNAQLAYIHSNGAPMHNIPARPFLEPSIEGNLPQITAAQGKVLKDSLEGKADQAKTDTQKLGFLASTLAKQWFTDPRNEWLPNAPSTIKKKGSDKPLIDTGQLRNAITYVVRDKNAE